MVNVYKCFGTIKIRPLRRYIVLNGKMLNNTDDPYTV